MVAAPPTRRRPWFSFSLRSLFVLITLAAIGLGWVAYERRQSRYELQIVEQLRTRNGSVAIEFGGLFDPTNPSDFLKSKEEPSWWRRALSDLCGPRIRRFGSPAGSNGKWTLADLSPFAGLQNLQILWLENTQVSDLAPLARLKNLKSLVITDTQLSDLSALAGLKNLQDVGLEETHVSDLTPLVGLKKLQDLRLDGTRVSDLSPLVGLKNLQYLLLDRTHVSDLTPLTALTKLECLSLSYTPVSDIAPLAGLKSLEDVWLDGTHVSDLTPLAGLKNLRELHFKGTAVSEEQIKLLQQALPNCKIDSDFSVPVPPAAQQSRRPG